MDEHTETGGTGAAPVPEGTETGDRDIDVLDERGEEEEFTADAEEEREGGALWVGVATGTALALVALVLLLVLSNVLQGLSEKRFEGDLLQKVGFAFLTQIDATYGLALVLAAALAGLPRIVGAGMSGMQERRRLLALNLGAFTAFLLIVATPIAVRARLHVLDLQDQPVDSLVRWMLVTFTLATLGTAAVALAACLGLARIGSDTGNPETVAPPP
jgi:hypothetical protein